MRIWPRVQPDKVIKVGWRTIIKKTFQNPNGRPVTYDTMGDYRAAVSIIIPLTADNRVVIAKQFRPGPEQILSELPGGLCDPDEAPLAAAMRELHEEKGYTSSAVTYLGKVYKDAYSNLTWHYYLARNCVQDGPPHTDGDGEHIEVELITIGQLLENARTANMTDCEAVFLAYETLKELEQS